MQTGFDESLINATFECGLTLWPTTHVHGHVHVAGSDSHLGGLRLTVMVQYECERVCERECEREFECNARLRRHVR